MCILRCVVRVKVHIKVIPVSFLVNSVCGSGE
jgi:hypothetical protein